MLFNNIVEKADAIEKMAHAKLAPVVMPQKPENAVTEATKHRDYPPLLSEFRSRIENVNGSLEAIKQLLQRVDL